MEKHLFKAVIAAGLAVMILLAVTVVSFAAGAGPGASAYNQYCAGCHGNNGEGTAYGPDIAGESASEVYSVVRHGDDSMPAYSQATISNAVLADLAAYVGSLSGCAGGAADQQYCQGGERDGDHDGDNDGDHDGDHDGDQCVAGAAGSQYCPGHHDERPDLRVKVKRTGWHSFSDYREGVLSVDYAIENHGGSDAHGVTIINPTNATNGARVLTGMPIAAGDIAVGSNGSITIKYEVPSGTHSYRAILYAKGTTNDGVAHYYPSSAESD